MQAEFYNYTAIWPFCQAIFYKNLKNFLPPNYAASYRVAHKFYFVKHFLKKFLSLDVSPQNAAAAAEILLHMSSFVKYFLKNF